MLSSIFLIPISIYFFSLIFFIYGVRYGIKNKSKNLNSSSKSKNIDCSIILCVRNGEESISKILNDFKNQTFSGRHEFIIVDDNSTDNSAAIIQDYANIDQRFKYIKSNSDRSNLRFKKKALNAGISAIKPGNTADDVAQAFWKVLDKYGIEKKSRTGYSIGIGYPPDWGEHTLNIYKGDMTVLEPNVCFHMIAVMQFGDWGVEASEAIRVTENSSELFCNFPKELKIKQ